MSTLEHFVGKYQVQKTIRFDLLPTEKTKRILEGNGKRSKLLLEADKKRAVDFIIAKDVIDRYHRHFIDSVLDSIKEDSNIRELLKSCSTEAGKTELRKKIAEAFQNDSQYNILFGKKLFAKKGKEESDEESKLYSFAKNKSEKAALDSFENFTLFFDGYHKNRKNMYVSEKQTTAIAYRIVNVNLPKFEGNIEIFAKIKNSALATQLSKNKGLKNLLKGKTCEEIFLLGYFVNVWKQSDIDIYNEIVGVINTDIKLFNDKLSDRKLEIPLMKRLFKQILGYKEDENDNWTLRGFESDNELLATIGQFYKIYDTEIATSLRNLLELISTFDLSGIYIHQKSLRVISKVLLGDGYAIPRLLMPQKDNESDEDYYDRIKKGNKSFTIGSINKKTKIDISHYFSNHSFMSFCENEENECKKVDVFETIQTAYDDAKEIINSAKTCPPKGLSSTDNERKLKSLLDSMKTLQHFIQPLLGKGDEKKKDWGFYNEFNEMWEKMLQLNILYDKVRNRMSQKLFSKDKVKVIFDVKRDFLKGWTDSKTDNSDNGTQYGGYLFRKSNAIGEYDYYLGISKNAHILRRKNGAHGEFERLEFYQLKSRTIYQNSYVGSNSYEEDKNKLMETIETFIKKISQHEGNDNLWAEIKKGNTPKAMIAAIKEPILSELLKDEDFAIVNKEVTNNLKNTLLSLTRIPKTQEYKDKEYTMFTEVMDDIEFICSQERVFDYFFVEDEEINAAQNDVDKPLLLFKISNKDLSFAETSSAGKRISRGTENLHTMYFKALMEGQQNVFDLGSGQIFFREKSIPSKVTHPANVPIENKNERVRALRPTRTLDYNLVKDKRYTIDKYLFHLSIKINYQKKELPKSTKSFLYDFNNDTFEYLRQHKENINIIGIDRGERNLVYVSLINAKGEHLSEEFPRSYNLIGNYDYQKKLKQVAKNRDEERKSWSVPERITDIKKGYLSQVVHEIATLAVRHHAIIVMENLSKGFKHGRFPIEHQVYQLFENMLVDKLSYLAFKKDSPTGDYGNIINGLQLAVPCTDVEDLKQNGWVFYVPAGYTSIIDPFTGFVNLFNMNKPANSLREFFEAFDDITYSDGLFYFTFDYSKEAFFKVRKDYTNRWTLSSHGTRIVGKNKEPKGLTKEFELFFEDANLPLDEVSVQTVSSLDESKLQALWGLFKLLLKMRNSNDEQDYIISPVASDKPFITGEENSLRIKDADANGAYNIALKGLYWLYYDFPTDENGYLKYIKDEDWFRFIQTKPYLAD
ncbi:MAG: type V CRISPR-associated protein Cas12a/Cpf1 [Prevotella sp.]|nr:type V CRISPR-associated protein Cas12a/Cpf1 [Prevotella sp.]